MGIRSTENLSHCSVAPIPVVTCYLFLINQRITEELLLRTAQRNFNVKSPVITNVLVVASIAPSIGA